MTSSGMRAWSLCELAALTAPVVVVFGSSAPALLMRTRSVLALLRSSPLGPNAGRIYHGPCGTDR